MNDETTNLDQTDEDFLTYTVSDEALEAAALQTYQNISTPLGCRSTTPGWTVCGGGCPD
jgi:hypothetical protein